MADVNLAATNTTGDFIRSVFSVMNNKAGEVFKALLANPEGTGTLESVWNEFEAERKLWCETSRIYDQSGEQLLKTIDFLSVLRRRQGESEKNYKWRNRLLFYRNGDTVWGTNWDIQSIFRTYLDTKNVWVVSNTDQIEANMLENGDFEQASGWVLSGCEYSREARFEQATGVKFDGAGVCSQTVAVSPNSAYFLHFFLQGKIRVCITDNHGRHWDSNAPDCGAWVSEPVYRQFEKGEWDNASCFFIADGETESATVTFEYVPGEIAFLDYARLFHKTRASTFSLIGEFTGVVSDETAGLAPGTNDPIIAPDWDKQGYYSPGGSDKEARNYGNLSYLDNAAINDDQSPIVDGGTDDAEPPEGYDNMTYLDGESCALSPDVDDGNIATVDYDKVAYLDKSFILGASGMAAAEIYNELLEIVKPAGVISYLEILVREEDEDNSGLENLG